MEINVRKKVYGFFLDRDANLYECAYLNNRNKLCTSTGERLKDKTKLVEKSAAKMPDGRYVICDQGHKGSGLYLLSEMPISLASMKLMYGNALCGPIRKSVYKNRGGECVWEFCEEEEASHFLLREKWCSNDDALAKERIVAKYNAKACYLHEANSKSGNTGIVWAILDKRDVVADLLF